MRAAPAFELSFGVRPVERAVVAALGGASATALALWLWSHIDAAAGPAGLGVWAWLVAGVGAAASGAWAGRALIPATHGTIGWQQGEWTIRSTATTPCTGALEAKLDLGTWMLLHLRPAEGGAGHWLTVRRADGDASSWHALRATLFAEVAQRPEPAKDVGT
jgi:hypothetical protein